MFSNRLLRLASLAILCASACHAFTALPVSMKRAQARHGLLHSYCTRSSDSQDQHSDQILPASKRTSFSRRAALPLLLAPFSLQPAFASDDLSFKDELAGSDGKAVDVSFTYPKSWRLERKPGTILVTDELIEACQNDPDKCNFGEIISRSIATGDNALVLVKNTDTEVSKITVDFFKKNIFSRGGKFGAYGAPEDVKFVEDSTKDGVRTLGVKWNTFTPGGSTLAKRSIITAQRAGPDLYMLVVTSSSNRYKSAEPTLRQVASSLGTARDGRDAKEEASGGLRKSMFLKDNIERAQLEKAREKEGIQ